MTVSIVTAIDSATAFNTSDTTTTITTIATIITAINTLTTAITITTYATNYVTTTINLLRTRLTKKNYQKKINISLFFKLSLFSMFSNRHFKAHHSYQSHY